MQTNLLVSGTVVWLRSSMRGPVTLLSACLLGVSLAQGGDSKAPFTLVPDHSGAMYKIGEPIHWKVEGELLSQFVEASYSVKQGGLNAILEGRTPLTNLARNVEATLNEPGTLLLEVKAKDQDGKVTRVLGGAVVASDQIKPSLPRPEDFDAFWQEKLKELSKVGPNPQLEAVDGGKAGVDYWKITMDNIRGTHIRGQLARPKAGERFPAMLIVQWAGVYPLQKGWVTDPAGSGWLVLNINAHDLPIDEAPEFYQKQSSEALKDYPGIGNDDRETSYFLRMYLSCYRAAQYLVERPDWDGKTLLVTGGSQGGLQALMTAGWHPKVTAAIASVPAGCDLTGPAAGRSPGWPMWYWKTEGRDAAKVREASRYFDVVNFASGLRCPVLVGVGLIDETCPPAGILAAVNQANGPKEIVLLPRGDHQGSYNSHQAFNDRAGVWKQALREGRAAPIPK
jgi:cephalosporin-C deacetylase